MVPPLRKAILEAKLPRRKLEDYPRELVGRRVALQWEAGGVMEAFVVSYNEQTGEMLLVSVWRGVLLFIYFCFCVLVFVWFIVWLLCCVVLLYSGLVIACLIVCCVGCS